MKKQLLWLAWGALGLLSCQTATPTYESFNEFPVYPDTDLWVRYSPEGTRFRLWSPPASAVRLNLYEKGQGGKAYAMHELKQADEGLWEITIEEDLQGVYYTYQVQLNGEWLHETPGIYATATGVNGERACVVDMATTHPVGWENDQGPELAHPNQAIIYELHVRDITSHPSSGSSHPGKYLGLVEPGTRGPQNVSTAIDHMKALGITHVHLLPAFDHYSIDETRLDEPQFNWGYDPNNYNVPEGSYASDPYKANVRIKEFKQMVQAFHQAGIGVILDVVYNHTGRTEESQFNRELPGYYYRMNADSTWSNASGCGNETASERVMMRKYIVESVRFWAREYHLDGFRFDLMGIHDMETMNQAARAVKEVNPNAFVYGEGWTAGATPLPAEQQALKKNTWQMPQVSAFSDDIRDGLKGSVFDEMGTGFVNGAENMEASVQFGVVGAIQHPQIDYAAVNYSDTAWASEPWQAVSYVSCHDNHTLYDKLTISRPNASPATIQAMHRLANAVVLTSQGIPFLHAGVEMMRTKGGEHNSYNLPDSVNQINWHWKVQHQDMVDYYRRLIHLRKNHPAFALPDAASVRKHLQFTETRPGLVGFQLNGQAVGDSWKQIRVYYNAQSTSQPVSLNGNWTVVARAGAIDENGLGTVSGTIQLPPMALFMAVQK